MAPALLAISFDGAASLLLFQTLLARLSCRSRGTPFGLLDQLRGGPLAESSAPVAPVELETSYQVVVHCGDEAQQRELFDRFTADDIDCRISPH